MSLDKNNSSEIQGLVLSYEQGQCLYSFPQSIRIYDCGMGWLDKAVCGPAARNLAANLLQQIVPTENFNSRPDLIDRLIQDIIQTIPAEGGIIPLEELQDWYRECSAVARLAS